MKKNLVEVVLMIEFKLRCNQQADKWRVHHLALHMLEAKHSHPLSLILRI
jgi:hypothetical protein